jgi:uncharacterized membrane protein
MFLGGIMYLARLCGYRVYNLIYYFLIYSFLGWCIETIYLAIQKGEYVSRGFLFAPICPIYGFGMLLIIIFLKPVKYNPPLYFVGSVVLTSALEYGTGIAIELAFNRRLWDYSDAVFNLGGLISLGNSLVWGLLAVIFLYFLHPIISHTVKLIPSKTGVLVLYLLLLTFSLDVTASVLTEENIVYLLFRK